MKYNLLSASAFISIVCFAENTSVGVYSLDGASSVYESVLIGKLSGQMMSNCTGVVSIGNGSSSFMKDSYDVIAIGNTSASCSKNMMRCVAIGNDELSGCDIMIDTTSINEKQFFASKMLNAWCINPNKSTNIQDSAIWGLDDTIHFNAGSVDFTGQNVKGLHVDSQQDHISDSTNFVYCNLDVILNKQERGPGHGYWTCKRDMNDQPYEEMTDMTFSWDASANAWKNADDTFLTIENGFLVFRNEGLMPGESRSVAFTGWDATYTAEMWNWFFYRYMRYHTDAPEVHTKLVTTNDVGNAVGATFRFENGQFCVYTNGVRAGTLAFTPN